MPTDFATYMSQPTIVATNDLHKKVLLFILTVARSRDRVNHDARFAKCHRNS